MARLIWIVFEVGLLGLPISIAQTLLNLDVEPLCETALFQQSMKRIYLPKEVGTGSTPLVADGMPAVAAFNSHAYGFARKPYDLNRTWIESQLEGYVDSVNDAATLPWNELSRQIGIYIPEQFHPILNGIVAASVVFLAFFVFALAQPGASGIWSLFLKTGDTDEANYANLRHILQEHGQLATARRALPIKKEKFEVIDLRKDIHSIWYFMPLCVSMFFILMPLSLMMSGWYYTGLAVPTLFVVYNSWRFGVHVAICSCVGLKKMALCQAADFEKLYRSEESASSQKITIKDKEINLGDGAESVFEGESGELNDEKIAVHMVDPEWDDVIHFVILPNYDEDIETLRAAIRTIQASKIAKKQIGLVMGMEAREASAVAKAKQLEEDFKDSFRYFLATFHPAAIPGETPGKHSNTKWAAQHLFDHFLPEQNLAIDNVVLTVADSDSDFHPEYFSALTYLFIRAGSSQGEVPRRHLAIWQAPILHIKNYVRQPALVRLCSWIASLHELANLADPAAVKLAYSTYSLSGKLAVSIGGWDPDWISEDMHMTLKCFLATGGRLSVDPIFLSVVNYAPESGSYWETIWARWAQAKRHALGFGELIYILGQVSRVSAALPSAQAKVVFMYRAVFMVLRILFIHLFLALSIVIGPLVGGMMLFFYRHHMARGLIPVFLVFNGLTTLALNFGMICSVLLYEAQKARIEKSSEQKSIFWTSPWLHAVTGWMQYNLLTPVLFLLASLSEWLAAIKVVRSHHFDYEVAPKPQGDASA